MLFTSSVLECHQHFHITWGDTYRIRDMYQPYFVLKVKPSGELKNRLPNPTPIFLYSFNSFWSDVYDNFNEEACISNSKFASLTVGSAIRISGPIFRKNRDNDGRLFRPYSHVIVGHVESESESESDWTINADGSLSPPPSKWLIESEEIPENELSGVLGIIVGWGCAEVVDEIQNET